MGLYTADHNLVMCGLRLPLVLLQVKLHSAATHNLFMERGSAEKNATCEICLASTAAAGACAAEMGARKRVSAKLPKHERWERREGEVERERHIYSWDPLGRNYHGRPTGVLYMGE